MVAQHLGHAVPDAAPVVTRQHHIGRSEASNAQVERAVRVLEGPAIADRADRLGTDLGTTAEQSGGPHLEHVLTS